MRWILIGGLLLLVKISLKTASNALTSMQVYTVVCNLVFYIFRLKVYLDRAHIFFPRSLVLSNWICSDLSTLKQICLDFEFLDRGEIYRETRGEIAPSKNIYIMYSVGHLRTVGNGFGKLLIFTRVFFTVGQITDFDYPPPLHN